MWAVYPLGYNLATAGAVPLRGKGGANEGAREEVIHDQRLSESRAALERAHGLEVPTHVRYARWIRVIVLDGTLGESLQILRRLPVTIEPGARSPLVTGATCSARASVAADCRLGAGRSAIVRST